MGATGVRHWSARSGGKVMSGLLFGAGILIMVLATFLHKSTVGFILGLVLLVIGIIVALEASLADKADRQRRKR